MSNDLFKFKDQEFYPVEFNDMTMREITEGPYVYRFGCHGFGKLFFVGLDDALCGYMACIDKLVLPMTSLHSAIIHYAHLHSKEPIKLAQFEEMKYIDMIRMVKNIKQFTPSKVKFNQQAKGLDALVN